MILRGVRFEELGPVDRRRSLPVSKHGRLHCPSCADSGRNQIGPFYVNRYLLDHLRRDHFRCECGWVGISPGAHLTRSSKHGPGVPPKPRKPCRVPISGLAGRMGERVRCP